MYLRIGSWAGTTYHPVEVVGETPKRYRVRILTPGGLLMPSRRWADRGDVVLVPKHAVIFERPASGWAVEVVNP